MGFALGALLYIMGLSALLRWISRKATGAKVLPRLQFSASYLFAWVLSIPIVAYGFADGGPPNWVLGVTGYLPAALVGCFATWVAMVPHGRQ